MQYSLTVNDKNIADFLYSMLEVYWLSETLPSIKLLKDVYKINPVFIERMDDHFFLMKIDSKNKIGYYISSDSLYDLISNCIDEESRLGAIYSNTTSDSELVDKFLENFLIKAISKYHESPELYKSIPFATNLGDLKNEWCRSNGMDG